MRLRSVVVFLAGTVFGVVLLARCGMSPATATGTDAGTGSQGSCLSSDGHCVADAGTAPVCDCPAPPKPVVLEHACDSVHEAILANDVFTLRSWYAEIPVEGLKATDAPLVSAVACDRQCVGTGCPDACPPGYTCTGYDPGNTPCASAAYTVEDGKIVVACGTAEGQESGNQPNYAGFQYQRAIVRLYPTN